MRHKEGEGAGSLIQRSNSNFESFRRQTADKGQMAQYPRWLDRYEKREGEEPSHELMQCVSEKSYARMELLRLEEGGWDFMAIIVFPGDRRVKLKKSVVCDRITRGCSKFI